MKIKFNSLSIEIFIATVLVAFCSIIYELVLAQTLTVIYGGSVVRYSVTIGLYLFSLGLGSWFCEKMPQDKLIVFVVIELLLSLLGSYSVLFVFISSQFQYDYPTIVAFISYFPILSIGFLSGMEIPLLTSLSINDRFSKVLSFDYFGALIGTVTFALYLYPKLGLIYTALIVGATNVVISAYFFTKIEKKFSTYRVLQMGVFTCVILSITTLFYGKTIEDYVIKKYKVSWIENKFASTDVSIDKITINDSFFTPYQNVTFFEIERTAPYLNKLTKVLTLDNSIQISDDFIEEFHYGFLSFPLLYLNKTKLRVAIIGGGDGLLIATLLKTGRIESIDHIDIDKDFVDYMTQHPYYRTLNSEAWNSQLVHTTHEDAFSFFRKNAFTQEKKYDLILSDLPNLNSDKLLYLYSSEFLEFCQRSLAKDGIFTSWIYSKKSFVQILKSTAFNGGFAFYNKYCTPSKEYFEFQSRGWNFDVNKFCGQKFIMFTKQKLEFNSKGISPVLAKYQKAFLHQDEEKFQWTPLKKITEKSNSIFNPNYTMIINE